MNCCDPVSSPIKSDLEKEDTQTDDHFKLIKNEEITETPNPSELNIPGPII